MSRDRKASISDKVEGNEARGSCGVAAAGFSAGFVSPAAGVCSKGTAGLGAVALSL
jgi:hypothetical protein